MEQEEELIGVKAVNAVKRIFSSGQEGTNDVRKPPIDLHVREESSGTASGVFKFLFWVHQILLGVPSIGFGFDLLVQGKTQGIISVIGFLLAWIGGTLVWGLAALMHQKPVYNLPREFAAIATSLERLEKMQVQASAKSAIADAFETPNTTR
jgi:hypothetical protein